MYLNFNCLLQKQNLPGNTCTSILLILYTCILHVHIPVSVDKNELKTLFIYYLLAILKLFKTATLIVLLYSKSLFLKHLPVYIQYFYWKTEWLFSFLRDLWFFQIFRMLYIQCLMMFWNVQTNVQVLCGYNYIYLLINYIYYILSLNAAIKH